MESEGKEDGMNKIHQTSNTIKVSDALKARPTRASSSTHFGRSIVQRFN